jgi:hypothetical protein
MSDRIPVYVTMGEHKCVGSASRTLANTIYRKNCADLHTEDRHMPVLDEQGEPVMVTLEERQESGAYQPVTDDDGNAVLVPKTERRRMVLGLMLKPFVVAAVRGVRHRVSRKQVMAEREAEAEPFPDATTLDDMEAPERIGGIVVGQDSGFRPDAETKEAAAKEADGGGLIYGQRMRFGMGQSHIDQAAQEHVTDLSEKMGGRSRGLVPLIQSRGYSGHEWEFGDTNIDFDDLWEGLDDRGRAFLYDEAMDLVQNASPTKAKKVNERKLLGPGEQSFNELLPKGSLKR